MEAKLRKTSIEVVGNVPWGTHFCQFYRKKEDLIDILVPYFKAGLEDNEFCMWITAGPLNAVEAHKALQKKVRNLDEYIKKGQIEILDYNEWYTKPGHFDSDKVLQGLVEKERNALEKGFEGFRFTGNICWLKKSDWEKFANYEEAANSVIAGYRMLAVCNYSLDDCSPSEIIDVVSNHQFALIKKENEWKIIRSSDRKKADEARQRSEHRYRTLVEANPYGIQEIDTSGSITYTNPAYQKMLGYTERELLGISILDLVETESKRDELRGYLSKLVKEQPQPTTYYQKNRTKDNRIIDMMVDWNYKRDNEGRVVGFTSVITDITERKKAQEQLKRSKEFITNIINTLDDPFFVKDHEHRWFMLNDAACKVMGRPREELIGKSDYDLFPKEQADKFWERDSFVLESGQTDLNEEEITWHGKLHTISTKKSLFTDPVTSKNFITGTIRDITELKESEKKLRESEGKLEAMLGSLAEHMSMMDKDLNIIWANKTAMNIFGDNLVGKKCYEVYHQRNKPCEPYPCLTLRAFQDGKVHEHDTQVVDRDGNKRYFHCNANVALTDEQGKPTAVLEISKDITEQKLNQQALKESEEKFRSLAEQSPNMIFINKGGKIVYANKKCEEITGYKREELYSPDFDFMNLITPESLDQIKDIIRKRSKGEDIKPYEYTIITKTGRKIEVINSSKLIQYDGETAILGVVTDITERKLAEEALRESEHSYKAVVENSAEGIVVVQSQMLQFVNPALVSMFGYSEKELLTRPFIEFIHPDHRDWAMGIHIKRLKGEEVPPTYEIKVLDKKGNVKWLENNGILFEWRDKPATLNFLRDITDRKMAEQAIWASESEKKSILNAISDHILFHDTNLLIRWGNEAAAKSIGMTQRELVGCYCYELWHGRSESCEQCPVIKAIETRSHAEGIMKTPDGKWWEIVGEPVRDRDGEIRGAIEISRDITERKDIEAHQKLAEQILECLNRESVGGDLIRDILKLVKKATCFDAVGIRQHEGNDFPYFEVNGFPDDFVKAENHLCRHNEAGELIFDSAGRPVLECMCGLVLSGRTAPTLPFFTEGGSFWTNSTTELLTSTSKEAFEVPTRNRCNEAGYESVALIPLRSGEEIIGLLQLNDTQQGRFTPDIVRFFEEIGASIGIGLARIRAEQEVENLARFPSENPQPVLRIAKDGMILYANGAGSELLGNFGRSVGTQAPEHWQENILLTLKSGRNENLEATCRDRIFSLTIAPVPDSGYVNVYGSDITERKHAEESLRKYQQQLEGQIQTRTAELTETNKKLLEEIEERKRLEKEILNISERVQKRIGQELHDSIGQQFTGIAFMTKVLEQKLATKLPDEATDAAEIKKLVNQAMDQARSLARGLHPVDLEAGSLTLSLQELAATTENLFGIPCTLKYDKSIQTDDAEVATHLYRITQEAINNAIKHGKTKNIRIELARKKDKSVLKVENDGLDFPEEFEARGTGMGLQIMDHRADIIGASLDIHKAPEGGTIVTCSFSNKTY